MKKTLIALSLLASLVCISVFPGCSDNRDEPKAVEQVGQIPDRFKKIVEDNAFNGVTAFDGRLLKASTSSVGEDKHTVVHLVQMMDVYGNNLATYTCTTSRAYQIKALTATDDGGFLFTLGFSDYRQEDAWASENGFATRVIKCDKDGNVQFDTPFDSIEGAALRLCFEKNDQFYFFGTIQTPETKTRGVYSRTDVYMAILSRDGQIVKTRYIAGSDFDTLESAEIGDDCFILSIGSQSDDGDFVGSDSNGYIANWVITVNDNLDITNKKKETGRNYFDYRIGEKGDTPVYKSDAFLYNFDAGTPEVFIDYGDFYLIVSRNNTGIYENKPVLVSAVWYYTETVYSAYDHRGNLIFRASVDSSPDYDSIAARYNGSVS